MMLRYKWKDEFDIEQYVNSFIHHTTIEYNNFFLKSFKVFRGNSIRTMIYKLSFRTCARCRYGCSYCFDVIDKGVDTVEKNCMTISLQFQGPSSFSVLIRPNGSIRLCMGCTHYAACTSKTLSRLINTERDFFIHVLENMFPFITVVNTNLYNILLLNGIYTIPNPIKNNEEYCVLIERLNLFACVLKPDFSGQNRRKGYIQMFINSSKKGGVVKINSNNFHLMGFTSLYSVRNTLVKIDTLVKYFVSPPLGTDSDTFVPPSPGSPCCSPLL